MEGLLKKFLDLGLINKTDKILVICGNINDSIRLKNLQFNNYLITSIDKKAPGIKHYQQADAHQLPFADCSFDLVIVSRGLHHCDSPHQALNEMYRVSRKTIIVNESQDSILVRLLVKLGITLEYETFCIDYKEGGLNGSAIPNFIYRWTKREVRKTINSFDPTRQHNILFFSEFLFYQEFLSPDHAWKKKSKVKLLNRNLLQFFFNSMVFILNLIFKNQGNDFTFIIRKDKSLPQPWINNEKRSLALLGRAKSSKGSSFAKKH